MRLHCSWAVLVAIAWTVQLCSAAIESNVNESTGRILKNPSDELEKSVITYDHRNGNRKDNVSPERSKDESDSRLQTTDTRIIMKNVRGDDIIVNTAKKKILSESTSKIINISTSISQNSTDGNNDFLETKSDFNHYVNDEHGVLQPLSQNSWDPISLNENTTISQSTNEGENCSEAAKASEAQKTVDVKTDDHTASENRSPHDTIEHEKLPRIVGKSEAVMQLSGGISQDIMSSTTEYSSNRVELMDFSSATIDNFTSIASISSHNGPGSLSSVGDSKVLSKETSSGVDSFMDNHGKEERHKVIDRTIINTRRTNLLDKVLGTNKLDKRPAANTNTHDTLSPLKKQLHYRGLDYHGTSSSFMETTNLQRENTNRATIRIPAKNNRGIGLSHLPRKPTSLGLVSGEIASGMSEKEKGKSSELPAAHNLRVDASFSENNAADGSGQLLTRISSQSTPYPTVSSEISEDHPLDAVKDIHKKLQNLQTINYPEAGKNRGEFHFASVMTSGSNEMNGEKATITSGNKAEENEVSRNERFSGKMDNVKRVKLADILGEGEEIHRKVELDNTAIRDSENKYSILRNVVKNTLADSQMKNRDHKILISPATRGINFQQQHQQLGQEMLDHKKPEREFSTEMDSLGKDGFLNLKNGATALENSSGLSLAVGMHHENNVLDSISSVTPKRIRKMRLSGSEPDDTRASWKMKTARKHLIILGAPEILEPRGSPKWQQADGERVGKNDRDKNLIKNDPVSSVAKIVHPVTSNPLLPTDSSIVELQQVDSEPDDNRGDMTLDCVDGNGTAKGFRARCRRQRSKAFSYLVTSISNSQKKSGHTFGEWRTTVNVDSFGVTSDGQRKRKRWKDKIATIAADTIAFKPTVSTLLKGRNDPITDVTHTDSSDEKYVEKDRNDEEREEFSRQSNYIRNVKIDETSGVSTVNRLKLRDSTAVNGDAPEIRRETRNDIAGEASAVQPCEACEIVAIVENTRNGTDAYSVSSDDRVVGDGDGDNREQRPKKIGQSIRVYENSKGTIPGRITKTNEMSVAPMYSSNGVGSLAGPPPKFKLIDRLEPEARVYKRMHQENRDMLVRGQQPIFAQPVAENLILSRKGVTHQPLSSEKLTVPDGAVTSGSMVRILNETVKNSSSLDQHVGSPKSLFSVKSKTHEEMNHGPLISGLTESFARTRISSHEFPNNATGIPRDYGNFNTYSTLQTGSPSPSSRRRKSVAHQQRTESWTSSTKIDSTTSFSIDRSPRNDAMRSHSKVSATRHQDGRLSNNSSLEQIKRGFTSAESTSIPVTAPALTSSYGHVSSITAAMPEDRDIKSTETIIRTTNDVVTGFELSRTYPVITEIKKSLNTIGSPPREIANIPVVELSNENPVILITSNSNDTSISSSSSFERDKLLIVKAGESVNLQRTQRKQTSENAVMGMGNIQTFNYTVNDNSTRTTTTLNQWPVKYSAVVEGDLVLGGLMMVHEREDSITCGPVMPQGGVQALEAMLYTLDWVNKRDLVPGVKIGAHILDDCDKDTYGLEMAVDFIKGSISNIDGAEYHCNKTAVRKVISGVVGAASSVTSIQVANLLRLFRIPQVSFFSTSPELSNKMRFEYFTRTIPSDHYQVKAMVDIVLVMGWSYVSIIYEESNYGEKAYEELEKLLGKHQICIAVKEKLSKDSGVAKAHVYDNIVLKLLTKPRARGCIIFASDQEVAGVMKAVRRCNATGAFSWIGSDGWSARSLVSDGNEPEMEGTLSVQPQANPVEGFEDYFLNLTVENNRRNPWFVEFWEDHFKCRYPNASQTPYNNYTEECTTTEKLTKQNTAFENQLQFVSDAVMAFAYAFRNMHIDLCHGIRGLCDAMKPTKGTELLSYLRTVQFKGLSGDVFHFDKNGDGPARYNIIHFKQVSPGKYKWIRVGKYLEGELRLNMSEIQFRLGHPQPPESVCSLPCEVGQAKKYVEGESCCWHCFNCTQYQIRHESDEKQCVLCPQGTVPDETHSYCRDIPENFLRPESGWAIGAMSFSSTGILITLFVGGVFLKHNDTPIVRASGRELSYVLLTGILLCYLVTFALVLRPNDLVCSIQRFSAGFCFTVVYAALLTKTNRISRIFNAGKHSAKRPSFISPRSQIIICSMLVAVQILINGVWMVIDPAKAMHHYPTREDNLLVCNSYIDASYMIAFTYPIILIVVCTVYAVLTRKIPEAFNESKHIGFTMYTTCVIWLAFVPLYFGTGSQVALRITSMSVTISLSASVTIACLFTPKLYIILIHPERNVRPNMMMTRYNTTKGSVVTATNASSMMAPVTLTAVTCDQNKAVKKHVITTMDCSTQSEQFEMEVKEKTNGKLTPAVVTRSTQTLLNNNGKESDGVTAPVIKDIIIEDNLPSAKSLNKAKIGNGPLSQNDIPL